MKRSLAIIALCALFNGFITADATIGKCHFVGERPPRSMSIGSTTVYYQEMSSSSVSRRAVSSPAASSCFRTSMRRTNLSPCAAMV